MTAAGPPAGSGPVALRIERGEACASLIDERWDGLVRRQRLPNPTLSAPWLAHLLETEPGEPVVIAAERDGALVAAGAFGLHRPTGRRGPLFARWLGDSRQWFSPDLLVDPEAEGAGELVVDALLGTADVVHLPARRDGPAAAALRARVPWTAVLGRAEGWVAPLPPPGLSEASKRARRDVERAARRGAEVVVSVASRPDDVAAALERLFLLHAERWRARGGAIARFSESREHRAWYRRAVGAMAERGRARIAEVAEDGEVVGSALALLTGTGGLGHTTAMRPGGGLRQPGAAAQVEVLLELERAGGRAVDLGLGACEPGSPKAKLGPERVEVERVLAAASRRTQRLARAALSLAGRIRGG